MSRLVPLSLAISGKHHKELKQHLYPGDGREAVALLLCGRGLGLNRETLVVQSVAPVPYASCRIRTPGQVTWHPEAIVPALTQAMNERLAVVKAHSHPGGQTEFSQFDDESDRVFFASVYGWLESDERLASVIMLPGGEMLGRVIQPGAIGETLFRIRMAGDNFEYWGETSSAAPLPDFAERIVQIFGEATFLRLRSLRVGVLGCSGTGSVVIEQLARNGIGELVVVDPDHVTEKNLNRIVNSTLADARLKRKKTDVMQRAVRAMGTGTKVYALPQDVLTRDAVCALASCDLLVGCVDSIDGRHILNMISSYYVIPYIDVGVRIDADGIGGVSSICCAIHVIQPGGSSLLSRKLYDSEGLNTAMLKRHDPAQYEQLRAEGPGYVRGADVDRPAVISVNASAAATAFNELLARIHPFRIQPNNDFAIQRISLSDRDASCIEPDGDACPTFGSMIGLGDQQPLLRIMSLA